MREQRSFLPLFAPCTTKVPEPDFNPSGQTGHAFLSVVSTNFGFPLNSETQVSGSFIANLGSCLVVDSSLLVLVREKLAITEAYGDARWCNYQLWKWPFAHNTYPSHVGVDRANPMQMVVKAYSYDDRQIVRIDRPCIYLSVRDNDRNPYHWIFETLPRLRCLSIVPELRGLPLLVRAPLSEFQIAFMRWLGIKQEIIATGGNTVFCSSLYFPTIPAPPVLNTDLLLWLRNNIASSLPLSPGRLRRRLYVSRRDAINGRRLRNEEQAVERLSRRGFESLVMSELSPLDQINAFRDAQTVVLPHGAAASFMCFARPDCTLIELHTPMLLNNVFLALTKLLDGRYAWLLGKDPNNFLDFTVNLDELDLSLESVL